MRAAFLRGPRVIELAESAEPVAGPGQVLIRPSLVGICGSDVSLFLGHRAPPSYPHVLGHELLGFVEAVGEGVKGLSLGQRVIVEPNYPCGGCSFCRSGRGAICPNKTSAGVSLPGFFSELCVAPAGFTWPVGPHISDLDAVTIEPLAVSFHALRGSGAGLGDSIAVIGCGATGLLLCQVAAMQEVRVLAHEKCERKLAMAAALGAIAPEGGDLAELWKAEGVSRIFDCAGVAATVELALANAPRGSSIYLLGLANETASFVPLRFVREGLALHGSLIYDHPFDFAQAISLVGRGLLSPSKIVSDRLPFEEVGKAFELASSGSAAKVVVDLR